MTRCMGVSPRDATEFQSRWAIIATFTGHVYFENLTVSRLPYATQLDWL